MTLLFLCFLLLAACLLLEDRLWLSAQRLPRNVSLYGEDLSSASFEQAKRVIGTVVADKSDDVIVIDVGEQSFSCFRRELGYPLDGSALLRRAKALNREGNFPMRALSRVSSLFRETRLEELIFIDEVVLGRRLREMEKALPATAEDARFFIDEGGEIDILPEKRGRLLDKKRSLAEIGRGIRDDEGRRFTPVIAENAAPAVTEADLKALAIDTKLAEAVTFYSEEAENRSVNIKRACALLDMAVVRPGESFSFNRRVGRRSEERGFLKAAMIENGSFSEGLGGGVCQVSTTLYGAALRADMKIEERRPHSLLSTYAEPGEDAMVSWGTSDLVFLNDHPHAVVICAAAEGGRLSVALYGSAAEKREIEIVSEIVATIPFTTEVVEDPDLPKGVSYTRSAGKNGLRCVVWRVYRENGVEVMRETVSEDLYAAKKRVVVKAP